VLQAIAAPNTSHIQNGMSPKLADADAVAKRVVTTPAKLSVHSPNFRQNLWQHGRHVELALRRTLTPSTTPMTAFMRCPI